MMNEHVSIILLNWNGWKDTIECLNSLSGVSYASYSVIICDNDSSDDSINRIIDWCKAVGLGYQYLDRHYKLIVESGGLPLGRDRVVIIQTGSNFGFAGGNNIGLSYAFNHNNDPFALLLNNDTEVKADFLQHLIRPVIQDEKVGLVGGRIYYFQSRDIENLWFGPSFIDLRRGVIKRGWGNNKPPQTQEVSFITGCMMLIRKELYERIGGLDERYFMNVEDWDYSLRAKGSGYRLWYVDEAEIYHKVSASSGGELSPFVKYETFKNRFYFIRSMPFWSQITAWPYLLMSSCFHVTKDILHGRRQHAIAVVKGMMRGAIEAVRWK